MTVVKGILLWFDNILPYADILSLESSINVFSMYTFQLSHEILL